MNRFRELWTSDWLTIRLQIALGVIFIVAALPKIVDPPAFAQMIYNYKLLPRPMIAPLAIFLPWLELLCGLALVLGIWRRTATIFIGGMLIVFIIAIGINLAKGNAVNCGCFDVSAAAKSKPELLTEMRWVIARDVGMLLMVAQLLTPRSRRTPNGEDADPEARESVQD